MAPLSPLQWNETENVVRNIASLRWHCTAAAERISGVNFDAVLRPSADEIVLIEITVRNDLDKTREDINKINTVRVNLFLNEHVIARCYIVQANEPTPGMIEAARDSKVKLLTIKQFCNEFYVYSLYKEIRSRYVFGSAFDPVTGMTDSNRYVQVKYKDEDGVVDFSHRAVAERLVAGDCFVLIGDYGTGKSRCVKELFELLSGNGDGAGVSVLAINLKSHWGASTGTEIIAGHLETLGLSEYVSSAMQLIRTGGIMLLLDGVDEVGAQVLNDSRQRRSELRKQALAGIRALVQASAGGVLITSRSHFFDSDEEMLVALGFSERRRPTVVHCADEFTDAESEEYLEHLGVKCAIPDWLPRKPLVFNVLAMVGRTQALDVLSSEVGELAFWRKLISTICIRESENLKNVIEPSAIRQILVLLAEESRKSIEPLGRLSVGAVRMAYKHVTNEDPDQAGELVLMRLCTLGRIDPSSADRQFVDAYIADGLRAEGLLLRIETQSREYGEYSWKQPLTRFGWTLLSDALSNSANEANFIAAMMASSRTRNMQAYGEIVSVLSAHEGDALRAPAASVIVDADLYCYHVGTRRMLNFEISQSYVRNLFVFPEAGGAESVVRVKKCEILDLHGISGGTQLPAYLVDVEVHRFENLAKGAQIKNSSLSPAHKLLIAIIHKVYFQPGGGREERSLLKGGFGQQADNKLFRAIINILKKYDLLRESIGREGALYHPNRKLTMRMRIIKEQLALSNDPIWGEVGAL